MLKSYEKNLLKLFLKYLSHLYLSCHIYFFWKKNLGRRGCLICCQLVDNGSQLTVNSRVVVCLDLESIHGHFVNGPLSKTVALCEWDLNPFVLGTWYLVLSTIYLPTQIKYSGLINDTTIKGSMSYFTYIISNSRLFPIV